MIGVSALWFSQRDGGIDVELPAAALPAETLPAYRESGAAAAIEFETPASAEEGQAENEQDCAPKQNPDQIRLAIERLEREVGLAERTLQETNISEYLLAAQRS